MVVIRKRKRPHTHAHADQEHATRRGGGRRTTTTRDIAFPLLEKVYLGLESENDMIGCDNYSLFHSFTSSKA